jgi:hypothetical protein
MSLRRVTHRGGVLSRAWLAMPERVLDLFAEFRIAPACRYPAGASCSGLAISGLMPWPLKKKRGGNR